MAKLLIDVPSQVLEAIAIKNGPARLAGDSTWLDADRVISNYYLEAINDLPEMQKRTDAVNELLGANEISFSKPIDEPLLPPHGDTVKARKTSQAIYNKGEREIW